MNFASFPYLLFLATSIFVYFLLKKQMRAIFLLFASYFFYSLFGFGFAALMLITTIITYSTSYHCYYSIGNKKRKAFFYLGLFLDSLIFILFKYIHIIDIHIMNWPNWSPQKLLIPIGISFYTFKTIGYCIDIYKRKYAPESSFIYYALSVSFFPQLIAGPIEKSVTISSQFKQGKNFQLQNCIDGGKLILWGLFKKIVIADSIAQIINPIFNNITDYNGIDLAIALIAFPYQIYADFSGYSDIAIGSAKCFGINLPANFNKPFFAKNLSEFWRRWHITFYKWLKEYIYDTILKGSYKQSQISSALKIAVIFLLVGLWHGATLNYLFYVLTAYVWLLAEFMTRKYRISLLEKAHIKTGSFILRIINYLFIILMFASFVGFLKGNTLNYSFYIFKHIFPLHLHHFKMINPLHILVYIIIFETLQYFQISPTGTCFEGIKKFSLRLALYVFILFSILLLSSRSEITFQYYQF
jgi:D-alanyl-lipoteichoic acid acyltransferase DltB (MBOAT superfamily)